VNKVGPEKKFRTALEAAVAYLIGMGVVKKDADVCEATGEQKGNFSSFKSGAVKPTKNFVLKFEDHYRLKLSDFDPDHYSLEDYILKKKSGPSQVPDHLLTTLKKQIQELQLSLQTLDETLILRADPGITDPRAEGVAPVASGKKAKA